MDGAQQGPDDTETENFAANGFFSRDDIELFAERLGIVALRHSVKQRGVNMLQSIRLSYYIVYSLSIIDDSIGHRL